MEREKLQHCEYCGDEVGVFARWPGDVVACGKPACQQYERDCYRAEREEAMYRAAEDDYERYR